MLSLNEMYPGLINSVETIITSAILAADTTLYVQDDTRIPEPPNLLVLGGNLASAETVKLTAKDGNTLTVERAYQGTAKNWPTNTSIARNFTEADYAALIANITALNAGKADSEELIEAVSTEATRAEATEAALTQSVSDLSEELTTQMSAEVQARTQTDTDLRSRIEAQEGLGGYVTETNFGVSEPAQEDITSYVKSDIWKDAAPDHADTDIFNGTRVTNEFDGRVWVLANTPDTDPPVFSWEAAGSFSVAIATTDAAGIIKASVAALEGAVDPEGHLSINGLAATLTTLQGLITSLQTALNTKADNSVFTQGLTWTNVTLRSGAASYSPDPPRSAKGADGRLEFAGFMSFSTNVNAVTVATSVYKPPYDVLKAVPMSPQVGGNYQGECTLILRKNGNIELHIARDNTSGFLVPLSPFSGVKGT